MSLQIKGLKNLTQRFRVVRQNVYPEIKEATRQAAEIVKKESEENAPVLTGRLVASHEVNEVSTAPDVALFTVNFYAVDPKSGENYGVEMHESFYKLGKKSEEKQRANGHIVGRKFLERAVDTKQEECVALVRAVTKLMFRKAFRRV